MNKPLQSPGSIIGNRIKSVRMLAGHSRKAFSEQTGISAATLRTWEEPPFERNGITIKGANRLISALGICGIHCTREWLMEGKGSGPSLIRHDKVVLLDNIETEVTWSEEESIFKDIESFKANNPNPIVAIVLDGSMLPFYSYGDYVGGSKKYDKEITSLIGLNCIVELEEITLIRKISSFENQDKYTLSALNIEPSVMNPTIQNVKIISAAKIIWHRSRERKKTIVV